jgi:hypothetical protein
MLNVSSLISTLAAFARNAGSIAAIVIAAANVGGLPVAVRAVLLAIGGAIQTAEHIGGVTGTSSSPASSVTTSTTTTSSGPGAPATPPAPAAPVVVAPPAAHVVRP